MLTRAEIEEEVGYVRTAFFSPTNFIQKASDAEITDKCQRFIDAFDTIARAVPPLKRDEQAIVTVTKRKTAALLADRVWAADAEVALDITFGWSLPIEIRFRAILKLLDCFEFVRSSAPSEPATGSNLMTEVERDLAHAFSAQGLTVVPMYNSTSQHDRSYRLGDQVVPVCVIDNLGIVDEEQLSWEQVVEFRRDIQARAAYRRFIHWLDQEMIGRSVQYISDELALRLERYEWALQKHGIETVLGSISDTLNPKSLISAASAGAAVDLILQKPVWSLLSGGGLLLGRAAVSAATALVARRDIEISQREIAYVHELKQIAR